MIFLFRSTEVIIVTGLMVRVCHSDKKAAELGRGLHLLFRQIPQLNVLKEEDIEILLFLWV